MTNQKRLVKAFSLFLPNIKYFPRKPRRHSFSARFIQMIPVSQTFFRIILPQVIKRILPSVTNEVITLVKDTSLAFSIAYAEMFSQAKALAASQKSMIPFVAAAIFYYVFNYVVAFIMEFFEKKMSYYH